MDRDLGHASRGWGACIYHASLSVMARMMRDGCIHDPGQRFGSTSLSLPGIVTNDQDPNPLSTALLLREFKTKGRHSGSIGGCRFQLINRKCRPVLTNMETSDIPRLSLPAASAHWHVLSRRGGALHMHGQQVTNGGKASDLT